MSTSRTGCTRSSTSPTASPCCVTGALSPIGRRPASARAAIVELMVGRDVERPVPPPAMAGTKWLLTVSGLTTAAVHDISFTVLAGEVLGIGGLMGAGRSELAARHFRVRPPHFRRGRRCRQARARQQLGRRHRRRHRLRAGGPEAGGLAPLPLRARQRDAVHPRQGSAASASSSEAARSRSARTSPNGYRSTRRALTSRSRGCRAATSRRSCLPAGWRASRES